MLRTVFGLVVLLAILVGGIFLPYHRSMDLPSPYLLRLPQFRGRILPAAKVQVNGAIVLEEEFDFIGTWGSDAVLTYKSQLGNFYRPKVILQAFRQEPNASGFFQCARKSFTTPEDWGMWHEVGKIEEADRWCLRIYPASSTPYGVMMISMACLGIWGICISPQSKKAKPK